MGDARREKIPDDWIPVGEPDSVGNPDGGTFIVEHQTGSDVSIVRYNEDRENDVIRFFDVEIPDLMHRLVDFIADDLE